MTSQSQQMQQSLSQSNQASTWYQTENVMFLSQRLAAASSYSEAPAVSISSNTITIKPSALTASGTNKFWFVTPIEISSGGSNEYSVSATVKATVLGGERTILKIGDYSNEGLKNGPITDDSRTNLWDTN